MLNINKKLLDEIEQYCRLNEIIDADKFINDLIKDSFSLIKYGSKPDIQIREKEVEAKPEPIDDVKATEPKKDNVLVKTKQKEDDNYEIYDDFNA